MLSWSPAITGVAGTISATAILAAVSAPAIIKDFFIALCTPCFAVPPWDEPFLSLLSSFSGPNAEPEPSRQGASSARQSSVFQPTVIFAPGSNWTAPSAFGSLTTKLSLPQTETRVRT